MISTSKSGKQEPQIVYLDTETTGLSMFKHQVWEVAYAIEDGPIKSGMVPHSLDYADPVALEINHYYERISGCPQLLLDELWAALKGNTICGANPAFDTRFIAVLFESHGYENSEPWHHRLLDLEAYAMGAFGYRTPQGFTKTIEDIYEVSGIQITAKPDHTAAGDVQANRAIHEALNEIYKLDRVSR